jgi:hypothetical protein
MDLVRLLPLTSAAVADGDSGCSGAIRGVHSHEVGTGEDYNLVLVVGFQVHRKKQVSISINLDQ